MADYLTPVFTDNSRLSMNEPSHLVEYSVMLLSVIVVIAIYYYTQQRYAKQDVKKEVNEEKMSFWYRLSYHKFYIDEFYDKIFVKPLEGLSSVFYKVFDKKVIDGTVEGGGQGTVFLSGILRQLQTGNIGFYVLMMVIGIVAILFFGLVKFGGF